MPAWPVPIGLTPVAYMINDLEYKAVGGLVWLLINQAFTRGGATLVLLIIGAAVDPGILAPIAFIVTITSLTGLFFEDVFVHQLVRASEADRDAQFSAARAAAAGCALVVSILIVLLSPVVAELAALPQLDQLLMWSLPAVWAQAIQAPYLAQLRRTLNFRRQALLSVPNIVLVAILAYVLFQVFGPLYALVGASVGAIVLQAILLVLFVECPVQGARYKHLRFARFFRFGGRLYAASALNVVFSALYLFVISRSFGGAELGEYFFADRGRELFVIPILGGLQTVVYVVLSRLYGDKSLLRSAFKRALHVSMMWVVPIAVAVALVAQDAADLFLGPNWSSSAQYLSLMAVAAIPMPINVINLAAYKALGRSDWLLRLEIAKKLLILVVLFASVRWGVLGVVVGQLILSVVAIFINTFYATHAVGVSAFYQIRICATYFGAGFAAFFVGWLFASLQRAPSLYAMIATVALIAVFYVALLALVARHKHCAFLDAFDPVSWKRK
ncbi:Polysaccharide biosynthesis protein [gamma proteobacterium NOR5-3]|nr:Polysaccharide biosynthesis protein [gamma proteobacterium NOR5-3]